MRKIILISSLLLLALSGFTQIIAYKPMAQVERIAVYGKSEFMVFDHVVLKKETFCNGQELSLICRYEKFFGSFCNCDYLEDETNDMPIIRGCRGTITYINGLPVRHGSTPAVASFIEEPVFYSGLSAKYEYYNKD